jgi:hypothetical protein
MGNTSRSFTSIPSAAQAANRCKLCVKFGTVFQSSIEGSRGQSDNEEMNETKRQEYNEFVKSSWAAAVNHKTGEEIPQVENMIMEDTDRRHFTYSQKIRHIFKHHGNPKKEKSRGQIAITEEDILNVPDIISRPSFLISGIKYQRKASIVYAKHGDNNTYVYIEEIDGKKSKTATFFNVYRRKEAEALLTIFRNNKQYELDRVKVITGSEGGGNPPDTARIKPFGTVATSINPADTSLSPNPAK